jgi:cellulose synthase/poly-beta-1,6-N-acetylglucosamine synthase-like glycosyltransferase
VAVNTVVGILEGATVALVALLLAAVAAMWLYQAVRARHGLRRPEPLIASEAIRFGVLVPAHNEAGAMGALMQSLRDVDYPRDRITVLFVADHCTDSTVLEVRAGGFECLDRQTGARGKAAALADGLQVLKHRLGDKLQAVAFFDADNIVHARFFQQAAAALAAGREVVQGHVSVHNWDATLFSRLNYMNAMVENRLEELARSQAGRSCYLRGHGMVFRREVLEAVPWQASTLVEDHEMMVRLVLSGRRVVWLEHARVDSVLPQTAREATVQRKRWAGGHSELARRAVPQLWQAARTHPQPRTRRLALHLMLDLLLPSHAVQLALMFLGLVLASVVPGVGSALWWLAVALFLGYVGYFLTGILLSRVPARTLLSILWAPAFIAWRTWIYLASLGGAKRWR